MSAAMYASAEREQLDGGKVRGGMIAAHLKWVTEKHQAEMPRFWNAMSEEMRTALVSILPSNWYDFWLLVELDRTISRLFGGPATLRELGSYSARMNLTGVFKVFQRASIHEFFESSAKLHPRFQDFGTAEYQKTGPTSGRMTMSNYTAYSPLFCRSAVGFYEEAVMIHGGQSAGVTETQCQCRGNAACVFVIRWK